MTMMTICDLDVEEFVWRKECGRVVDGNGVLQSSEAEICQRMSSEINQFQMTDSSWSFEVARVYQHVRRQAFQSQTTYKNYAYVEDKRGRN